MNWLLHRVFPGRKLGIRLMSAILDILVPFVLVLISAHIIFHLAFVHLNNKIQYLEEIRRQVSQAQLGITQEEDAQRGYDLTLRPNFQAELAAGQYTFNNARRQLNAILATGSSADLQAAVENMFQLGDNWSATYGIPQVRTAEAGDTVTLASLQSGMQEFSRFEQQVAAVNNLIATTQLRDHVWLMWLSNILWGLLEIGSILCGTLVLFFTYRKIKSISEPITALTNSVSAYTRENFDVPVPAIELDNEIADLIRGVDTMRQTLKSHLAMVQSEQLSLFHNSSEMLFRLNCKSQLVDINDAGCEMLQVSPAEVGSQSLRNFIAPLSRRTALKAFLKARDGIPQKDVVLSANRSDGSTLTLKASMLPIKSDATVFEVYGIAENVTEREKTTTLLRNADKLKTIGELAAGVAHEIRNPLTVIQGFVQLLQSTEPKNQQYVSIIASEVERMKGIVNEFMFLAKPQDAAMTVHSLHALLLDVFSLISAQSAMQNIEVRLEILRDYHIRCVANQLKQVFINLLKNALEAMDHGGEICISLSPGRNDTVRVEVMDEGCGIPSDKIPKLGEPFFTTKEKGNGLGLMVCHRIVEHHGGAMTINSTLGEGTTITLTLPTAASQFDTEPIYAEA